MTRALPAVPLAALAFVAALALTAAAVRTGFIPDDAVRLWAGATAAGGGDVPIGRVVAAYPSVPFLSTVMVALVTPDGTPAPALIVASVSALIAGAWFASLRAAGFSLPAALVIALLLLTHPALLRAAIGGPADACLVLFLYLFGRGLYALRSNSATVEVMMVGLSLLGLAFSHPMGAAIAFAAVPFLVFVVRPALIANSAFNIVIALIFPTVFAIGAFMYVSWVFPGSGWSFYAAPAETLSSWSAGVARVFGGGFTGLLALEAGLAVIVALAFGAPLALFALVWVFRRRPLVIPALVFAIVVVVAAVVTVATGLFGDPTAIIAAAPVLSMIVAARVPLVRERLAFSLGLLALGWIGGVVSVAIVDPVMLSHVAGLAHGDERDSERLDALALGGVLAGRNGGLIDTDNAPAVVLGRGRAHGLLDTMSEPFALALLFARLEAPFVAVPNPQSATGANDRLAHTFPDLYRWAPAGYRLIYYNSTWKLFEKVANTSVSKD